MRHDRLIRRAAVALGSVLLAGAAQVHAAKGECGRDYEPPQAPPVVQVIEYDSRSPQANAQYDPSLSDVSVPVGTYRETGKPK